MQNATFSMLKANTQIPIQRYIKTDEYTYVIISVPGWGPPYKKSRMDALEYFKDLKFRFGSS